jgi:Ca-activated chloride channel family protein
VIRTARIWLLALFAAGALLSGCDDTGTSSRDSARSNAPDPNAFTILAGSELKDVEPAFVDAAAKAGVPIRFTYAGTLDIVERVNGGEKFDAILPPNGAYPALALASKPVAREKLFYSRVALGVKTGKAQELHWDATTPTWADIARAAKAGQFRYGMTNPTSSNTGMSALFAVASAVAHKTEDLTIAEVDANVLKDFLSGQALTAGSSGWLAEAFEKDPSAVDGLVNYEAVLLRLNAKLGASDKLTIIYPTDGVISADYPLMLLSADKREQWQKIVDAIKATPFQRDALQVVFLRPSNPDAPLAAELPKTAVAELTFPNQLAVIDEVLGAYQSDWRRPATSIFVLDVSGSMEGARLDSMRQALKILSGAGDNGTSARYARFQNRERVVLISFSSDVAQPQTIRFEGQIDQAREAVRSYADHLRAEGGTAIYSALAVAEDVAKTEHTGDPQRYVSIVLLTDGENNEGMEADQFKRRYARSGIRIFPILFGEADPRALRDIAEISGGRSFDARKAALASVFKEIRGYQ